MLSGIVSTLRSQKSTVLLVFLLVLSAHGAHADALNFFNNWFVTGGHAVAGTGLAATAGVGTINMTGVPCTSGIGPSAAIVPCSVSGAVPAYPIAAFLYWQTVENTATAAAANGIFDGKPITGRVLGSDSSSACWLKVPFQTLRVYRADVLRFLDIDPRTHLRVTNGAHPVRLGNALSGNAGVLPSGTLGASLVMIYRVVAPGNPAIAPLRSVVIYDGAYTLANGHPSMTQKVFGFYQASSNPAATMTHIVGNGQAAFRESLKVGGDVPTGVSPTQPLVGAQGPNWDNLTFGFDLKANASSTETKAVIAGNADDCLSWSTIITSANVQDTDGDGLLDIWEKNGVHRNTEVSPATFGNCASYPNEPCVNLPAMGAKNGVKDVFLQVDWMHGFGDGVGGIDGTGRHSHIPRLDALSAVATAYAAHNIALHFDVGNAYQGLGLAYIIPFTQDGFGSPLAQGGSDIEESSLLCHDTSTQPCTYHTPYPVLSFKLGFDSIKDGNHFLNIPAHLAQNRRDVFHYVLFAHAVSGPFDLAGKPLTAQPTSISGVADRPGQGVMITLGLWRSDIPANDQVGSTQVQAGTLMHELGHNLGLSHAGWLSTPNCMPNYESVMSYLYQTRGLTGANGLEFVDYSSGGPGLLENAPTTAGLWPFRVRYYTPFNGSVNSVDQAAKLHCDGTTVSGAEPLEIRLESPSLSSPDWANGTGPTSPLDLNFDGVTGETFTAPPDWKSLNLAQIGGALNFGSLSAGSLAIDAGSLATDAGSLAVDAGSLATDAGSLATDAGSLATDAGSLATDAGSLATDAGDEDYDTHILSTTDRIPFPQQCAGCGLKAANGLTAITLSWTPPETGIGLTYNIYRCTGAGCTPKAPAFAKGVSPLSKTAPTFVDTVNDTEPFHAGATCPAAATCYNTIYTYSATAVSLAGTESVFEHSD